MWLAAGLWVSNEVLLQPLAADQPACRLDLGACQPRSLLVCELQGGASGGGTDDASSGSSVGSPASSLGSPLGGGSPPRHDSPPRSLASPAAVLLAGTSSGEVLWWRMHVRPDPFGAGGGTVRLEPCGWVRAGLAPVALHVVPADPAAAAASAWNGGAGGSSGCSQAGCPCVLAQSDQGLLLRPASGRLVPSRLHGARGLLAACPLLAPDVPGSRLAYVDQAGQLSIGGLDTQPRLHADLLPLPAGAEASAAAYHAPSGCAAVACSEAGGGASLRLVDAAAMRELARLPMQAGQAITSVSMRAAQVLRAAAIERVLQGSWPCADPLPSMPPLAAPAGRCATAALLLALAASGRHRAAGRPAAAAGGPDAAGPAAAAAAAPCLQAVPGCSRV